MKVIAASILSVSIAVSLSSAPVEAQSVVGESFRVAEQDFASPDAALSHFVASVKASDPVAALQVFAVSEYSERYDFKADIMRLGAIMPMMHNAPGRGS